MHTRIIYSFEYSEYTVAMNKKYSECLYLPTGRMFKNLFRPTHLAVSYQYLVLCTQQTWRDNSRATNCTYIDEGGAYSHIEVAAAVVVDNT